MKRLVIFLVVFFFAAAFAQVEIEGYNVKSSYGFDEYLKGQLNLSLRDEAYEQDIVSNQGQRISFGDFLDNNGEDYNCSPLDCSMGYDYSMGESVKRVYLSTGKEYVGFYIEGGDVEVSQVSFSIDSNFEEGAIVPLNIDFFEMDEWKFNWFSESYLGKNWGCYEGTTETLGALIGNSFYCEMISIPDSGSLRVGAKIGGSDNKKLIMAVYPESGTGASWECEFDPNSEEFCEVAPEGGEVFNEGKYQVCVGANSLTGYKIYSESGGESCGFVYGKSPSNSVKDYGIFVQNAKYADANQFGWDNFDFESITETLNEFIQDKYGGNCEDGCVLPLSFYGVPQEITLSNINLIYTDDDEWKSTNVFYDLDSVSALVNFDGSWDLEILGFKINRSGKFSVSLGDKVLFEEDLELVPAPIINSIFPLDPPAGVLVKFYASVNFSGNKSVDYYWDFGDGSTAKTKVAQVDHRYNATGDYVIKLRADAGGDLVSEKEFSVKAVSPEEAILFGLAYKMEALDNVKEFVESLPTWYGDEIYDFLELDSIQSELDKLAREYNFSSIDEDFVKVAEELFALKTPDIVGKNVISFPYFVNDVGDVDVEPIEIISGSGSGDNYAKAILTWQNQNIKVDYVELDYFVDYNTGERETIGRVYSMNVASLSDEESYLIIKRPFSELIFNGDVGARKAGDYAAIILNPMEQKKIEFYYEDGEETMFFVSPRLASLVTEADIDEDCNYNYVCEAEDGETWRNCRTDCKPVGLAVWYFVLGFFVLLIVYTGLQIWYNKRYEHYLFKDSGQLYNLLMYISNARARGMEDLRIEADLRSKGWSSERVNFAMKKSRGKRVGMFEVIPISKISAWMRDRKARKTEENRVATFNQGNIGGNINKPVFPRRF